MPANDRGATTSGQGADNGHGELRSAKSVGGEYDEVRQIGIGAAWNVGGNVVNSVASWALLAVTARLIGPKGVGDFGLGIAITAPVFMFASLRLRYVLAADAKRRFSLRGYLVLRQLALAAACAVTIALAFMVQGSIGTRLTIVAFGAVKLFDGLTDVYYGSLQRARRMDILSKSMMWHGLLGLGAFSLALYTWKNLWLAAFASAAASALVYAAYDTRAVRAVDVLTASGGRGSAEIKELFRTCLPLGFVALLSSLSLNIPRYIIRLHGGSESLGYYTSISYIHVAGLAVFGAFAHSSLPAIASRFAQRQLPEFRRLLLRLCAVAGIMGLGGILVAGLAGDTILTVLYGEDFGQHGTALLGMMLAAALNYFALIGWFTLTAMNRFGIQAGLFVADVILVALVSFLTFDRFGIGSGAAALCVAFVMHIAISARAIIRGASSSA